MAQRCSLLQTLKSAATPATSSTPMTPSTPAQGSFAIGFEMPSPTDRASPASSTTHYSTDDDMSDDIFNMLDPVFTLTPLPAGGAPYRDGSFVFQKPPTPLLSRASTSTATQPYQPQPLQPGAPLQLSQTGNLVTALTYVSATEPVFAKLRERKILTDVERKW